MKHDIIYIKRTGRWICKCGEHGYTEKSKNEHEIDVELEIDPSYEYVDYDEYNKKHTS